MLTNAKVIKHRVSVQWVGVEEIITTNGFWLLRKRTPQNKLEFSSSFSPQVNGLDFSLVWISLTVSKFQIKLSQTLSARDSPGDLAKLQIMMKPSFPASPQVVTVTLVRELHLENFI